MRTCFAHLCGDDAVALLFRLMEGSVELQRLKCDTPAKFPDESKPAWHQIVAQIREHFNRRGLTEHMIWVCWLNQRRCFMKGTKTRWTHHLAFLNGVRNEQRRVANLSRQPPPPQPQPAVNLQVLLAAAGLSSNPSAVPKPESLDTSAAQTLMDATVQQILTHPYQPLLGPPQPAPAALGPLVTENDYLRKQCMETYEKLTKRRGSANLIKRLNGRVLDIFSSIRGEEDRSVRAGTAASSLLPQHL